MDTENRRGKGGAAEHEKFRGSRPPDRGLGHEDTAGGDIPCVPETDAGVDIRQVVPKFARDRLMVKLAHDSDGSLDCASDRSSV